MGACCDARGGEGGTRPGLVGGPPGGLRAASAMAQPRAHASRGAAAAVGRPGRAACLHARAEAAVATWLCSRAGAWGQGGTGPQSGTREGAVVALGGQQAGEDDEHDVHGGARRKRENEVRESIKRTWSRETKDTTA